MAAIDFVNVLKRRNSNGVAESELEQADKFNGQFTDVFNRNEHNQVPLPNRPVSFMNYIIVSAEGVAKLLKRLNPSKAVGPDELYPRVIKELASESGPVFAHLCWHGWNPKGMVPGKYILTLWKKETGLWFAITVRSL